MPDLAGGTLPVFFGKRERRYDLDPGLARRPHRCAHAATPRR